MDPISIIVQLGTLIIAIVSVWVALAQYRGLKSNRPKMYGKGY